MGMWKTVSNTVAAVGRTIEKNAQGLETASEQAWDIVALELEGVFQESLTEASPWTEEQVTAANQFHERQVARKTGKQVEYKTTS